MDRLERVRARRDEYEAALDEAEKLRAAYHREIVKLHRSGVSLREIAEGLGVSHQRVHQIVGVGSPARRRGRWVGGATAIVAVLLVAGTALGLASLRKGRAPVASSAATRGSSASPAYDVCRYSAVYHRNGSSFAPLEMTSGCADPGAIVALDPRTGRVLAAVSPSVLLQLVPENSFDRPSASPS